MKTLTADYETKLGVLAQAAKALQVRHNELATLVVGGVDAKGAAKFRRAKLKLDEANAHFDGVIGQLGDLISDERVFVSAAAV